MFAARFRQFQFAIPLLALIALRGMVFAESQDFNYKLQASIHKSTYRLEVAETDTQAQKGLMFRSGLAPKTGMAFPFEQPRIAVFWMKNTLIPLDMVFVRDNRIVRILENVPPCSSEKSKTNTCQLYSSIVPVDMTLELPAGTAKTDKLRVRQHVKLKPLNHSS